MKSKIYIVFCALMIISINFSSCLLPTILSSDVIDDEQIARSTETIQSKGIPDEIETDNSDKLEVLPRNDVPVLANSVVNLVSEHSKESNEERTSRSDSAVPPPTSSSPNAEVEITAENEAENHKAVDPSPNELSSSSTTSSDGRAPIEIPPSSTGSPDESIILTNPSPKDSIDKVLDDKIIEFISPDVNETENATPETIPIDSIQEIASQPTAVETDEIVKDELLPESTDKNASDRNSTTEDAKGTENRGATVDKTPTGVNLTVEENQIPVFSEWAQKRLEEVEKEVEQEVVNTSTHKRNTSTASKAPVLKLRGAKNYASPDCGAKIIAANSESSGTSYVLTSGKDDYLLSPCKSRIWFVVELCEAIQAEHIDLANFELFSSSPKNFSVAVSNRFPTRDWSNVGRFIAKDERYVQSFDLHPHLFGKYVRVDIHSHYNSEHFCPISLFRVYGTSEFEAFETENRQHPIDDLDDGDDDDEETTADKAKSNIFKSASDAVMSIVDSVKKAAAFVKPQENKTNAIDAAAAAQQMLNNCVTPNFISMCDKCSLNLTNEMNALLRCKHQFLNRLLSIELVKNSIRKSQFCANVVGIDMELHCGEQTPLTNNNVSERHLRAEYVLQWFPIKYVAAMCNLMAAVDKKLPWNTSLPVSTDDAATNVTIDKKAGASELLSSRKSKTATKNVQESEKIPIPLDGAVRETDTNTNTGSAPPTATTTASNIATEQTKKERDAVPASSHEEVRETSGEGNIEAPQQPTTSVPVTITDEVVETTEGPQQNIFNIVPPSSAEVDKPNSEEIQGSGMASSTTEPSTTNNNNNWDSIEDPLDVTTPPKPIDLNGGNDDAVTPPQFGQKLHSESVFLRLSNRVKALERNMSLSGQYLEELSRRYKRQVEELQQSFAKTLLNIEEQSRHNLERKQELFDQNQRLRADLEVLTQRVFSWRNLLLFCACFLCIQIILFYLLLRIYTRKYLSTAIVKRPTTEPQCATIDVSHRPKPGNITGKVRRKSAEEKKNTSNVVAALRHRPSSEALHIAGTYEELLIKDGDSTDEITIHMNGIPGDTKMRNRALNGMHDDFVRIEDLKELYDKPALNDDYALYGPPPHLELNKELSGDEAINDTESTLDSSIEPSPKKNRKFVKTKLLKGNKKTSERRLSSPSFFKAPFSGARNSKERSTGWEWHLSKKSQKSSQNNSKKSKSESPSASRYNGIKSNTPNVPSIAAKKLICRDMARDSNESMRSSIGGSSIDSSERSKQGSFRRLLKKIF